MKRRRLKITDSVSRRWLSSTGCLDGFPYLHCGTLVRDASITALGSPPNDQVIFVFYPTLFHVKPVNAAASRSSSLRLSLIITLAESVSFRRVELAVKLGLWSSQVPISRNFEFNGYKKVAAGFGSKGRSHEPSNTSPSI